MNKKVLGVIGAIVVIGLVVYFMTAKKGVDEPANQETNTQTETNDTSNQPQTTSQNNSLKGLLASGSQKCTYSDAQSQGTVYTANGKARMDMSTVTNGVTSSMHAVIDGTTYYSWVDGQPSGFKFSTTAATGSAGTNQNVDLEKKIDYNCDSWSADVSMFVLPANVQFTDLSSFKVPGN